MVKILATGVCAEHNFGTPSIMHGFDEMLKLLYGNDYQLTILQPTETNPISISDFAINIVYLPYSSKKLLIEAFRHKICGISSQSPEGSVIKMIKDSDIIVNLHGIMYCDKLNKTQYGRIKSYISAVGSTAVEFSAHILGKKTIKHTASYGPMKNSTNKYAASFASKHIFSHMIAREKLSRQALSEDAKVMIDNIPVSPDVANLFSITDVTTNNTVGISVSHKIKSQWKGKDGYIECMVQLCKHISVRYNFHVLLIPNEFNISRANDISVAKEISESLFQRYNIKASIPDVININSTQLKRIIASCEVIIASRYHTCVASLSTGVPLLMLGWHYKYQELAELYGQEKWVLLSEECSIQTLIDTFDSFYSHKDFIKKEICEHYPKVREEILNIGRLIYTK